MYLSTQCQTRKSEISWSDGHLRSTSVRAKQVPPAPSTALSNEQKTKKCLQAVIFCFSLIWHCSLLTHIIACAKPAHVPIHRSSIMQACWLTCVHYIMKQCFMIVIYTSFARQSYYIICAQKSHKKY